MLYMKSCKSRFTIETWLKLIPSRTAGFTVLASGMEACWISQQAAIEIVADYIQMHNINYKDTLGGLPA